MNSPAPTPAAADPTAAAPQAGARRPRNAQRRAPGPRTHHPLLDKLAELHPQLFGARFLPLKIGIFEDLMTRHPEAFDKEQLKLALGQHARSTRYLECVATSQMRCDLDGQPVEPLAPEHVQHAVMEVFRRRQARSPQDLRLWLRARLVEAIEASGLSREAYLERVRTSDPVALEALDEAFGEIAERNAKEEALLRAYRASGRSVAEFAEMYGLVADDVERALARAA